MKDTINLTLPFMKNILRSSLEGSGNYVLQGMISIRGFKKPSVLD